MLTDALGNVPLLTRDGIFKSSPHASEQDVSPKPNEHERNVWMSVEAAVSLSAAWVARSPALLAFGGDSAIELLSAAVVLWSFRAHAVQEHAERRASRIAGILLFVLAAYVVATSALALLGYSEPKPTYLGIAILIAAAAIVPWLASQSSPLPLLSHYQNVSQFGNCWDPC